MKYIQRIPGLFILFVMRQMYQKKIKKKAQLGLSNISIQCNYYYFFISNFYMKKILEKDKTTLSLDINIIFLFFLSFFFFFSSLWINVWSFMTFLV